MKPWLSVTEFAALKGVTRQHISNLCKQGRLEYQIVEGHYRIPQDAEWERKPGGRPVKR